MARQTITGLLKAAFPHLKAASGLPPWLLPERSLDQALEAVGDGGLLRMGRPLGLAAWADGAPEPASLSPPEWPRALKEWRPLPQFGSVVAAFIEVAEAVTAQLEKHRPDMDPMAVCRSLAVLLFVPFVDRGRPLLEEMARALGNDAGQPATLITAYAGAVARGDIATLEKVHRCILRYGHWREWASVLQAEVLRCRLKPRLIAVTPAFSADVISVLAAMVKEEMSHDESGGDHPGSPGGPVLAR